MKTLSKKEIIAELKKLGIDSTSEIKSYFKDYRGYSSKPSRSFIEKVLEIQKDWEHVLKNRK